MITKTFQFLRRILPYLALIAFIILCWRWLEFSNEKNHNLMEPVINGVVGGIVTSILLLIFSIVWKSNITPWVENLLYKDTKIEGVWNGLLIPFVGIDEIDKRRLKVAMAIVEKRRRKKEEVSQKSTSSMEVSASALVDDVEKNIDAELILKGSENAEEEQGELIDRKIFIKITSGLEPIEIRAEIKRVGHSIRGSLVEIGGASDIHTYSVKGSFKNLILTGEYENDDCCNIDRGSLSLMLRENGNKLEGFFSSYVDGDHNMAPFKCVLTRHKKQ